MDRFVVTSFNYLAASLVSIVIIGFSDLRLSLLPSSFTIEELLSVIPPPGEITDPRGSLLWALIVGVPAGAFFFLAFIYYQKGIRENGAGLAGAFSKIGILIPMSVSIVLWNEIPTIFQAVGIGLSIISILLVNISPEKLDPDEMRPTLLGLFLFSGLAEFSNKVFQKYGLIEDKMVFLFFVFFTAFLISAAFLFWRRRRPVPQEIFTGLIVGLPNLFCSYFLILALDEIKASVVFPLYTATTIVIINIGGYLIFKERLRKKERFAISMIVVALVLINLS